MINKLTIRKSYDNIENYYKYVIQCPCCGTILNFGKDDVYKAEDDCLIHHEYIDCPECNEKIQLNDEFYYGNDWKITRLNMVIDERDDWMLKEYNQQMRIKPSNITFEQYKVAKGYVKMSEE